jgi:hypothetical protein
VREAFVPVAAFYLGWKLRSLVVGIVLASAVGVLDIYARGQASALSIIPRVGVRA